MYTPTPQRADDIFFNPLEEAGYWARNIGKEIAKRKQRAEEENDRCVFLGTSPEPVKPRVKIAECHTELEACKNFLNQLL